MKNNRYAKVIPSLRLPRSLGVFDYQIPRSLPGKVTAGSIVQIPFRRQTVHGVILKTANQTVHRPNGLKSIIQLRQDISLTPTLLKLVLNFSEHYFVSPATVLNMILRSLPVRGLPFAHRTQKLAHRSRKNTPLAKPRLLLYNKLDAKNAWLKNEIAAQLARNENVLLIAPEIEKVIDWSRLLAAYQPIIIHRQLAPKSFWQNYQQVIQRRPGLVIGTRTALFLPFDSLSLIVIDEEDNPNHRQAEQNPRYQTGVVAEILAKLLNSEVLCTSQTPRVTTWAKVKSKKIELVDIVEKIPAPETKIVDLKTEFKLGNRTYISEALQHLIQEALKLKERTLLFFNKRGEAGSLLCRDCTHVFACQRCQKALNVIKAKNQRRLECPLCRYQESFPLTCPVCHGSNLKKGAWGIQRVALEIQKLFPNRRILTYESFRDLSRLDQADLVIGSQRALHPRVIDHCQSVAVVSADSLLSLPDFSASEQSFRLLYALSLLCAKFHRPLLIQSFQPDHPAVRAAASLQMEKFYETEIASRQEFHYPPAAELVRLFIKNKNQKIVQRETESYYRQISNRADLPPELVIVHPGPSYLEKIRGLYSWQIVMKFPSKHWPLVRKLISLSTDDWLIDLNPPSLAT